MERKDETGIWAVCQRGVVIVPSCSRRSIVENTGHVTRQSKSPVEWVHVGLGSGRGIWDRFRNRVGSEILEDIEGWKLVDFKSCSAREHIMDKTSKYPSVAQTMGVERERGKWGKCCSTS